MTKIMLVACLGVAAFLLVSRLRGKADERAARHEARLASLRDSTRSNSHDDDPFA